MGFRDLESGESKTEYDWIRRFQCDQMMEYKVA